MIDVPVTGDGSLRERILAASLDLLATDGVGKLSLREVARRAGVSHQAPYHHFRDREAILAALAQEGFEELHRVIERVRAAGGPAIDRLNAAGQAYVDFACARPAHFRLMFRPELVEIHRHPECKRSGDTAFASLVALVRECVAEGHAVVSDERALTVVAWSVAHGLACLLLDGPLSATVGSGGEHQHEPLPEEQRAAIVPAVFAAFRTMLGAATAPCAGSAAERPRR